MIDKIEIPILMYHGIDSDYLPKLSVKRNIYSVNEKVFSNQIKYLKKNKFKAISFDDLFRGIIQEKSVILTFDDGCSSNYYSAFKILSDNCFNAEFFITTDWIGKKGYLNKSQIIEMENYKMRFGTHGKTHSFLNNLKKVNVNEELKESKYCLEDILGKKVDGISYPGGRKPQLDLIISNGYKYSCCSYPDLFIGDEKFEIPRFVIMKNTKFNQFYKIIKCNKFYIRTLSYKYKIKSYTKDIIGHQNYFKIHKMISKVN